MDEITTGNTIMRKIDKLALLESILFEEEIPGYGSSTYTGHADEEDYGEVKGRQRNLETGKKKKYVAAYAGGALIGGLVGGLGGAELGAGLAATAFAIYRRLTDRCVIQCKQAGYSGTQRSVCIKQCNSKAANSALTDFNSKTAQALEHAMDTKEKARILRDSRNTRRHLLNRMSASNIKSGQY